MESELIKAIELEREMYLGLNSESLPLEQRAEEIKAGPFVEHEDSKGHLTYHLVRQYKG